MCTDISGLSVMDFRPAILRCMISSCSLNQRQTSLLLVLSHSELYLSPYPASGEGDAFVLYALRCLSGVRHHKSRRPGTDPIERRAQYPIHKK